MAEEVKDMNTAGKSGAEAPMGFGARIRAAREAAGISLGDMAVRSRLSVQQLRALEDEDMGALPEPVYVRAFIRGVAGILELDAQALQDDYSARFGRGMGVNTSSVGQVPEHDPREELVIESNSRHRGLKISFFVVFLLLLAAGGWALYTDQFGSNDQSEAVKIENGVSEPAAVPPAPAAQPAQPAEPVEEIPVTPAPAPEPVTVPAAPAAPAVPTTPVAEAPAAAQTTPIPEGAHEVVLEVSAPCWTQITTPEGRRLVARELRAGDRVALVVPKESRFRIGNAPAMSITVDGAAYDYAHTVRAGVASFVLQ